MSLICFFHVAMMMMIDEVMLKWFAYSWTMKNDEKLVTDYEDYGRVSGSKIL